MYITLILSLFFLFPVTNALAVNCDKLNDTSCTVGTSTGTIKSAKYNTVDGKTYCEYDCKDAAGKVLEHYKIEVTITAADIDEIVDSFASEMASNK